VIDPDSPTAPHHRRLAGEFRTRTAIPSTFQTIPWTMAWERRLEELIGLGTRLGSDPSGEVGAERLVWIVAGAKHEGLSLTATIQKKSKQGNWSPGRVIPVEQLLERSPSDPLLSEQDRSVIAQLARPQAGHPRWGPSRAAPAPVLAALLDLVGHPRVYLRSLRQDRPAQVVRGEPRLDIGKQKDHLLVSMHPVVTSAEERQLVDLSDPGRIVMYDLGAPQSRIGAIVGEGLRIPLSAETKVLEALRVIGPYVPVHSDVGDDLEDVEEVLADSRLHVLLSRAKVGILVTIRVQPFGERGPLELPGVGGRIMTSTFEGHRARTRRDPGVEREAYQELLARCPSLGETESTRGEWELSDLETALEFLSELEAIRENLVVSWPEGEAFLVGRTLEAQSLSLTLRERKDYFSLTGELVIDEQTVINITDVLKALEEAKGRFLPLGDGRFVALSRDLARRLADLEGLSASSGASLQIHPLMALVLEGLFAKAGTLEGDRAWKARLDRMREAENLVAEVPASLGTDLRSYQVEGFQWMARLAAWGAGTCLADDMGLGKTIQALAMLLRRASGGPALIVAPTSVVSNWLDEMRKFAPSLTPRVLSTGAEASETGKWGPRDVTIVSYALLSNAIETLARSRWHTLILDEAQSIKNSETVRFKAAVRLEADWKCALTGTPIENHLGELWSLFRFLNPGLLGSLETFRDRYAIPIEKDGDREAQARLRRLVTPFVLRRTKNQVLQDLPPRTDIVRKVSFEPEERAFYEAVRRGALERLGSPAGEDQRIRILAEIMKLRRACCHPRLILPESGIPSSKLRAFEEIVEELIEGKHRSLVFSQFVGHLALLKEALDRKGIPHEYLDGSTPMAARRTAVESFQDGTAPFFLISLKAGGLGLNLTAADYVIHMDPWWNPAVEDQASDRAHRIGQTRPVTIYRIVAEDTIEEKILELHHRKRNLADRLFEGAEQAQALSVDELMGLLREESQGS